MFSSYITHMSQFISWHWRNLLFKETQIPFCARSIWRLSQGSNAIKRLKCDSNFSRKTMISFQFSCGVWPNFSLTIYIQIAILLWWIGISHYWVFLIEKYKGNKVEGCQSDLKMAPSQHLWSRIQQSLLVFPYTLLNVSTFFLKKI